MTSPSPQAVVPRPRILRLIHASMVAGVVIFIVVSYLLLRARVATSTFPPQAVPVSLALVLAGCAVGIFMRGRVPKRLNEESVDAFWARAATPAIIAWATTEGPSLFAVVIYMLTGSTLALGVAGLGVLSLILGNPASFERRTS